MTVSDTQVKCLEYAAYSVQDWCDNAIHNGARIAQGNYRKTTNIVMQIQLIL